MSAQHTPGPWKPAPRTTHNGQYWTVERDNPKFGPYMEFMTTKSVNPVRFKTEEAAQKRADKANAAIARNILRKT